MYEEESKNSMQKKVLLTSRRDVRLAETKEKLQQELREKCTMQLVHSAEKLAKFLLNQKKTVLYTAVSVLQSSANNKNNKVKPS